jgi:hypothetical protein
MWFKLLHQEFIFIINYNVNVQDMINNLMYFIFVLAYVDQSIYCSSDHSVTLIMKVTMRQVQLIRKSNDENNILFLKK